MSTAGGLRDGFVNGVLDEPTAETAAEDEKRTGDKSLVEMLADAGVVNNDVMDRGRATKADADRVVAYDQKRSDQRTEDSLVAGWQRNVDQPDPAEPAEGSVQAHRRSQYGRIMRERLTAKPPAAPKRRQGPLPGSPAARWRARHGD